MSYYSYYASLLTESRRLAQTWIIASSFCLEVICITSVHILLAKSYLLGDPQVNNLGMAIFSL